MLIERLLTIKKGKKEESQKQGSEEIWIKIRIKKQKKKQEKVNTYDTATARSPETG